VLQLKIPYRDATTHIMMSPQEFMQPLAALIPRPRLHLIRFYGVLAPHAKLRAAVVPGAVEKPSASSKDESSCSILAMSSKVGFAGFESHRARQISNDLPN